MFYSFVVVFKNFKYILLALVISFIYLLVAILIPSYSIIKFFWGSSMPIFNLIKLAIDFFISNSTNLTRTFVLIISILSGLNFSMLVFYLKKRISLQKNIGTGFLGMIAGILGIGCASCGSIILSSIFGLTAATNFLRVLPFNGLEFGIVGILLLLLSIYFLSTKIQNPLICKVDIRRKVNN